jgi:UDP-N-acetylglucosamine 3-dehydrogenase
MAAKARSGHPLRVGMVGLTSLYWPIAIARGLARERGAKLLAAATLGSPEKAVVEHLGMTAEAYAIQFSLTLYRDAEEMIRREKLDAVVLCVPHSEHADWAEKMARLGVDIYIAKSFATTLSEATRIVQAGKTHGVNIACGPSDRYHPAIFAAKTAIAHGLIGEPFALRLAHHHGTIDGFHKNDWYRRKKEGGPELSLAWYVIDLAMHLTGSRVKQVFALYRNYTTPASPFMDCGKMVLSMGTGAMVSCDMFFCNRFPYPTWEMEIIGTRGAVVVHADPASHGKTVATLHSAKGIKPLPLPSRQPDREVAWVEGFRKGRPAVVPAEEALEITRISLAALESARTGKSVSTAQARGRESSRS